MGFGDPLIPIKSHPLQNNLETPGSQGWVCRSAPWWPSTWSTLGLSLGDPTQTQEAGFKSCWDSG